MGGVLQSGGVRARSPGGGTAVAAARARMLMLLLSAMSAWSPSVGASTPSALATQRSIARTVPNLRATTCSSVSSSVCANRALRSFGSLGSEPSASGGAASMLNSLPLACLLLILSHMPPARGSRGGRNDHAGGSSRADADHLRAPGRSTESAMPAIALPSIAPSTRCAVGGVPHEPATNAASRSHANAADVGGMSARWPPGLRARTLPDCNTPESLATGSFLPTDRRRTTGSETAILNHA